MPQAAPAQVKANAAQQAPEEFSHTNPRRKPGFIIPAERSSNELSKELPIARIATIRLASSATIESWSSGEVTRPDTIDYRNRRPVDGGLFCERIFGPLKNWECGCGKYRGVKYEGRTCDRCRVHVGRNRLRRERMGHIVLAAPVVHVWLFRARPSRLATLLNLKPGELEKAIYLHGSLVIEPGGSGLKVGALLSEETARMAERAFGAGGFRAETGAAAVESLLAKLDLATLSATLREEIAARGPAPAGQSAGPKMRKLLARLRIVESLRESGNDLASLILRRLPVIPPDLRPMVALPSGGIAASDVNELYRRVLTRNERLKRLVEMQSPRSIVNNEKRLLQQAVDALLDNRRAPRPTLSSSRQPLRSLAHLVEGKEGRFRQSLLGKRVDYSARSVIVVGPELALHQCGLPKSIAVALFRPFLLRELVEGGEAVDLKAAKTLVAEGDLRIWPALERVMTHHPVILNRAPTLHRMNVQAFLPMLVEGRAIRLHPLVCKAFNADFDGDQMAVHLPLSIEAQVEARALLLAPNNLFSPASGRPVVGLSQDIVLGCHYATLEPRRGCAQALNNKPRMIGDPPQIVAAVESGRLQMHDEVIVRLPAGRRVLIAGNERRDEMIEANLAGRRFETTAGRVLFDELLPPGMPFYNLVQNDRTLARLVADCRQIAGEAATVKLLDRVKSFGFRMATASGLSVAVSDLRTPVSKTATVAAAERAASEVRQAYDFGRMSAAERHEALVEIWTKASQQVAEHTFEQMAASHAVHHAAGQPLNGVYLMSRSGARGGFEQIRQLAGMRGLMARPSGEILETPIVANFREGLSVIEYFQSTHGARKGLADTALRTSQAGHLTRRLADVAQTVIVTEADCGASEGIESHDGGNGEVSRRRSPLACRAAHGVCQQCYGDDLSTGKLVELGAAVGVIAAQSIGEPGVQLTMRTFHQGGAVSERRDITQGLPRVVELFERRGEPTRKANGLAPRGALEEALAIRDEAQAIYSRQGAEVHDKHFEVVLSCLMRKVRVESAGQTRLIPGSLVDRHEFAEANATARGAPATGRTELLGVTKAALASDSFLSAASFQETSRVLIDAALAGQSDELVGLKENVIVGELPPCGTGYVARTSSPEA